jgi:predicted nucleotidyltransferase
MSTPYEYDQQSQQPLLTREEISRLLEEISIKLAEQNKYGEIIMCGGASMSLVYNARDSTHDIDAIFTPKEDLLPIIEAIAEENKIDKQWLNDDFTDLSIFTQSLESVQYKSYSHLQIKTMNAESLLAMKVIASRPNTHDMNDTIVLMQYLKIESYEQVIDILNKHKTQFLHPKIVKEIQMFAFKAYQTYQSKMHP